MQLKKYILPALALVLVCSLAFTKVSSKYFEISKNLEIFSNVYKELNSWYVEDLDPTTVMTSAIKSMMDDLDPYTVYYSESQIEGYQYQTQSTYDGVGADIRIIDDMPTIIDPYENSPAIKAGLRSGDRILAINGKSAEGKSRDEVKSIVRGVPGTEVLLKIQRPGMEEPLDIQLVRGEVKFPNVPYSGFVADGIGYIALTTFTRNAGRNVGKALRDLKTENPDIRGVVFDLRGNGGGLLSEAVNVCNTFIPKGEEVASTRGKVQERDKMYKTMQNSIDEEIPLVVMINNQSASASEIVAGVIQDYDRGVIMGQRSYGKGLVQNTRDVGYNARIKMTTAKYYIPSGRCIQSVEYENGEPKDIPDSLRTPFETRNGRTVLDGGGIKPDIVIPDEKDPPVIRALKKQDLIFKYVTEYCLQHDSIPPVEAFAFREYDSFVSWVQKQDFQFETPGEKKIEEMHQVLKESGVQQDVQSELKAIRKAVAEEKAGQLQKYQRQISDLIETAIVKRYYFETGETKQRLKDDPEINQAIALLNDPGKYAEVLE